MTPKAAGRVVFVVGGGHSKREAAGGQRSRRANKNIRCGSSKGAELAPESQQDVGSVLCVPVDGGVPYIVVEAVPQPSRIAVRPDVFRPRWPAAREVVATL